MKCSLRHERAAWERGCLRVAGIDEAGRGPLAGPVVAAAVILPAKFRHRTLTDSKKLSAASREQIYGELTVRSEIAWGVAVVDIEEIDRLNILRASHEAMRRAVALLSLPPDHVLIDGLPVRPFPIEQTALIGGDALSFSIAAASVIAKVTRDRIMVEMDRLHPGYEFCRHKGYGTALHLARLREHGPSPIHRRTFLPVQQASFAFASPGENPDHWLGKHGEALAAKYLKRNRYKILYRNFRGPRGGEVDIVCRDKTCNTLAFVEVKTRRSLDFGAPSEAVNRAKQKLIARGALAWLDLLGHPEIFYRFDIVEVVMTDERAEFHLIKDAFKLPEPYID